MSELSAAYPSESELKAIFDQGLQSPDAAIRSNGQRLVHVAAADGNCGVIRLVKEHGGDLNALDSNGKSAVNVSLERRRLASLQTLLELGADPNCATLRSESTLHQATLIANSKFVEALLEAGASCESADKLGDWPIHKATLEENVKSLGLLMHSHQHQVNLKGNRGLTALHIAANVGNAELFAVLAEHGADICAEDLNGRTPIDIVIGKQDNYIIDTYGYLVTRKLLDIKQWDSFGAVLDSDEGKRFLNIMILIDHDFRSKFMQSQAEKEYCTNKLDDETNQTLLTYIESDERIDINEFVQIIVKAVRNGLVDEIIGRKLIPKISESIFRHVLMSENEKLLLELMRLGMLWSQIVMNLEGNYIEMYEKSLVSKKVGIRGLVWRNCLMSDDRNEENQRVSNEKLHRMVASVTKLWQLEHCEEIDEDANTCSFYSRNEAMKDPVQTLAMWSILTGRFKLTPLLLRQEPYDLIPQSLLAAKLLRALSSRRDIEDVFCNKAEKVANTCEGVAIQALRSVKDMDTSQNNILTMEFLRMQLPSYGEYSVIDLAARGASSSFVTIDVVQDALDMYWYSDFFFMRSSWKMEAAITIGFIPPLMLLLPRVMSHIRRESPRFLRPDQGQDAKVLVVKEVLDSHNKAHHTSDSDNSQSEESQQETEVTGFDRPLLQELAAFYQMPCVKFRLHVTAHVAFVLLLSIIVVRDFGNAIGVGEIICYLCLLGFFVEELNEIIECKREESLASYFSDGWNLIDLFAIFCGLLSFLIRLEQKSVTGSDGVLYWSLVLLSTTCLVYWIRLLFASVILQSLGPKLKMMALMVRKDFMPFLYILFILMVGFGVIFQALLYPPYDTRHEVQSGTDILFRMFKTTFYIIVGDYSIESTTCDTVTDNSTSCVHEVGSKIVPTLFMVPYIVTMQILLLNVIVAMFSKTIDAVNNESRAMWQFEKYDLIQEFFMRASLPPPFNTALELRKLISWLLHKVRKQITRVVEVVDYRSSIEIYIHFLYYQAISFRKNRSAFNGVVIDEEDLDEGSKIMHSEIMAIQKQLKRLQRMEAAIDELRGKRPADEMDFRDN